MGALALDVTDAADEALRRDDAVEPMLRAELLREREAARGSRFEATELAPLVTAIDRKPRTRKNFSS